MRMVRAQTDAYWPGFDVVAVDPGINFGMSVLQSSGLYIYNGRLQRVGTTFECGWYAYNFIQGYIASNALFVLEGAAYKAPFGQADLANVRAGFYMGARYRLGLDRIRVAAPMTVRKAVFGNGKIKASEIFPNLNINAADSIGLLAFGLDTSLRATT